MRRIAVSPLVLAAVTTHGCGGWVSDEQRRLNTGLALAAVDGNVSGVDRLIARGAEVNGESVLGGTPLGAVVERGHVEMIRYLVRKGARIGWHGPPLLHLAASSGDLETFTIVASLFPDLNIVDDRGRKSSSGQTPYIGEWKDAPDAGKQIVELVAEHVAR